MSVLDPALYQVDAASAPARLALKGIFAPPLTNLRAIDAVAVEFTAGYGDAGAVPQPIKQAILMTIADLCSHRGDDAALVGPQAQALLAPYRIFRL